MVLSYSQYAACIVGGIVKETLRWSGKKGLAVFFVIFLVMLIGTQASVLTRNFRDLKRTEAKQTAAVIALAVTTLYKDVGQWPSTDQNGPSWRPGVDRLFSAPGKVPQQSGPDAGTGAASWGKAEHSKAMADFLFFNNPNDDSGKKDRSEDGQDYDRQGEYRWRGPYLDHPETLDPWGRSYVINARYFPENARYPNNGLKHRVYVLSAGPNGLWETPFDDAIGDGADRRAGDDIGVMIVAR